MNFTPSKRGPIEYILEENPAEYFQYTRKNMNTKYCILNTIIFCHVFLDTRSAHFLPLRQVNLFFSEKIGKSRKKLQRRRKRDNIFVI